MQPPPQSRLLQYRQVQSRSPGDPSSPSAASSNHMVAFPSGPYPQDPGRDLLADLGAQQQLHQQHPGTALYNHASYPHHHALGPPASPPLSQGKYLPPEAQWSHGGAASGGPPPPQQSHLLGNQGHSFPYGMPLMGHPSRQEQVHMMQLHQQQQQQSQGPGAETYHHPVSPRTTAATTALHTVDEVSTGWDHSGLAADRDRDRLAAGLRLRGSSWLDEVSEGPARAEPGEVADQSGPVVHTELNQVRSPGPWAPGPLAPGPQAVDGVCSCMAAGCRRCVFLAVDGVCSWL